MIRILLPIFLVIITFVCIIYYENPSVFNLFYTHKLVNPRSWGKLEIVEEKPISSLKDILQSELVWQISEQVVGFAAGVLICVLIGWRISSYRNIYEKSFENSLTECLQRQSRFEKQLSALELQVVDFERTYLYTKKETTIGCDSCQDTSIFGEEAKRMTSEENVETCSKDSTNLKNEGLVRRAVEVIMKQDFDESNFEFILEKLTKILERLSKLSKENICPALDFSTDTAVVDLHEQATEKSEADGEEYNEKESEEVKNEEGEMVEEVLEIDECGDKNETSLEEVEEIHYSYSDASGENSPYELHPCTSNEKLADVMISIKDAGECEETFRGKIVPISQIPKYQEFRKSQKQRTKPQNEYDDKSIPFITGRNTPDQTLSERAAAQFTPRRNSSTPIEKGADRSTSRGGRRKQRS